ncbi:MAG: hypothetical protein NWQ48_02405 [Alishewanella sp.]|nr:hypothetical protein [Alishewanella sp.]
MRWFSGLIILLYLTVLCTPHSSAVYDVRVLPQMDSQLQAVPVALPQFLANEADEEPEQPDVALLSRNLGLGYLSTPVAMTQRLAVLVNRLFSSAQARAPPLFLSI